MRNLDQLEVRLMHGGLEALVALPVTIGLLDDDAALGEQGVRAPAMSNFFVFGVADARAMFSKSQNSAMLVVSEELAMVFAKVGTPAV